jgi:DNA-binding transcriptional LysR family regulator
MNLSLDELRSFLETTQQGTISGAAKVLGVTQPTLSSTIRRLEERLEARLFVRSKQGVRLTRAGDALASRARDLLRQWEHIETAVRDEHETVRGTYSIGVYPALADHTLPRFLPELLGAWPELKINIGHDFSKQIAQDVIAFRYDLGIVVNPPLHPDLTIVDLYADEVQLWQVQGALWPADRPRVPVVCNPRMPHLEPILSELQARGHLKDCRFVHTSDLRVIASLTAAGCGLGLLPATIAHSESKAKLVPYPSSPVIRDRITLIWRRDAQGSRASEVIRQAIVSKLKQGVTS